MIDTTYLNQVRSMSEQDFLDLVSKGFALVNVAPVNSSGWAIFGPSGVYTSPDGNRVIVDLATAHALLAKWGVKRFFEIDQLKVFS